MPSVMELERLITIFTGDAMGLLRECDRVERALKRASNASANTGNVITRTFSQTINVAQQAANVLMAVVDATKYLTLESIKTSMQMEVLEASFKALIGSAEESSKLLQDLSDFALKSPFVTPQLMEAAIELAAFGRQADEILPDLKMIGDIARGDSKRFQEMVYIYGKIIESGRLYQRDINQLAIRGVPVYIELAKMLGMVNEEAKKIPMETYTRLRAMIQTGQVNAEMVHQIFQKITSPGGLFFGQTEQRMKTLAGVVSNVEEHIVRTMRRIGDALVSGMNLKPIMTILDETGRQIDAFFKNMTPEMREIIRIVIAVTASFYVLSAAVVAFGVATALAFGWVGVAVGFLVTAIALTTRWVVVMGGLEEAFVRLKRAAMDFWEFIRPALPMLLVMLTAVYPYMGIVIGATVLLVKHWEEVREAVEEFYDFIRPTLQTVWSLTKTVAFGIRDALVAAWERIVVVVGFAAAEINRLWQEMGGNTIDWNQVKTGLRDFVLFIEYSFRNAGQIVLTGFDLLKYGAVVFVDEVMKHILLLPAVIIGAFIFAFVTVKNLITGLIRWMAAAVPGAIEAIIDAIKNLEVKDLDKKIVDSLTKGFKVAREGIDEAAEGVKKAVGKVDVIDTEVEGIKIPLGLKIGGLAKLRQETFDAYLKGAQGVQQGFDEFRRMKLQDFMLEDLQETFGQQFKTIWDTIAPKPAAEEAGKSAGYAFSQAFMGEAKALDAVLFNSAEAVARINTYTAALRDPMMIESTRRVQNTVEVAPMPHEPQQKIVDVLERIDQHILDQTNKFSREGQMLMPAGL